MGSGKNSSTALTRKVLCIFIESTKFLLREDARNIFYCSFCSKDLGIIIRCCKILWGFCSVGKSRVLWSSNMLPGCGQGADLMIHVISSSPFFLSASVSALLFLPRKEECKLSFRGSAADCFLTFFSSVNNCCPWDNSSMWTHRGMQSLALLAVQNVPRDGFQTIMNVLFVLNRGLSLETSGMQMLMFPAIKFAWQIRS